MRRLWLSASLLAVLVLGGCGPYVDPANIHDLADQPAGALGGASRVGQRFRADCDGLSAVDLQLAVYPTVPRTDGRLLATVSRETAGGPKVISRAAIAEQGVQPDQWVRLVIPRVADSRGATFDVAISSTDAAPGPVTVWATSHWSDPSAARLVDGSVVPGSLTFRAYCDESPVAVAAVTWNRIARSGLLWPVALLLLVLPGLALISWLEPDERDVAARLGSAVGWSVLLAPLALALATPARLGDWTGPALLIAGVAGLALGAVRWRFGPAPGSAGLGPARLVMNDAPARGQRSQEAASRASSGDVGAAREPPDPAALGCRAETGGSRAAPTVIAAEAGRADCIGTGESPGLDHESECVAAATNHPAPWPTVAIVATLAALVIRAVVAKDLVVPAWGDPVQHSYVVQLILQDGGIPADYGTLVPRQVFDYHFGFQALAADAAALAGSTAPDAVLWVGQILDALIVLAIYRLARDLTGSAPAGAVAAVLVGLVTVEPTYYVSWGRYPELAGLVAMPAAYATLRRATSGPLRQRAVPAAVLACAAMILVHPRIATFLAALALVDGLVPTGAAWREQVGRLIRILVVGGSGLLLCGPWIARLWAAHHELVVGPILARPAALDFPVDLAISGSDRWIVALGLVGAAVALLRRRRFVVVLALWAGALLVVANPWLVHLPVYVFVNGGSLAIAAFVPATVLVGYLASSLGDLARRARPPRAAAWAAALAILGLGLARAPDLTTLLNPTCLLMRPGDLAALSWVRENTPSDARLLIDGYLWNPNVYMGSDAGYWLPVLAGRATTLPPLFYAVGSRQEVQSVNLLADQLERAAADPEAVAELAKRSGARYVFVGARGGELDPGALVESGRFSVAYAAEGAWVLELRGDAAASAGSGLAAIQQSGDNSRG